MFTNGKHEYNGKANGRMQRTVSKLGIRLSTNKQKQLQKAFRLIEKERKQLNQKSYEQQKRAGDKKAKGVT